MVGEITADEVMLVTQPFLVIISAVQQNPGVLDAARSQHEPPGSDAQALTGERPGGNMFHRTLAGQQVDIGQVGMEKHLNPGVFLQVWAIQGCKTGRRTVPDDPALDLFARGQERPADLSFPVARLPRVPSKLKILLGKHVIGIKVAAGDRPATVRDPVPPNKVLRIQRSRPPRPMIRAATEIAESGCIEAMVAGRHDSALIKRLRFRLQFMAAAFHNAAACPDARQLHGQNNAGRSSPDDADVGIHLVR